MEEGTNEGLDLLEEMGEAKELICTTHGHELSWEECWREWGCWAERGKGEKKCDSCNSISNKIY